MTSKLNNKYWTRDEDIEDDFAAVSDIYDNSIKRQHKPSAQERRARSKPSLFIDDSPEEEYLKNGLFMPRGRGAAFLNSDFRLPDVGGVPSFLQKQRQEEITNDIRETSEFRFSSDDIVKSLNQPTEIDKYPHSSLSSKSSDSGHVSFDSPFTECTSNGESHSPSPKEASEDKPPPLYDILKAGRNAHKAKIKLNMKNPKKCENIVPNNILQPVADKTFDINSKYDFPELN